MSLGNDTAIVRIRIPQTPAEFRPPEPASMRAEMQSLLRQPDHYAEVLPLFEAIAGDRASINGSSRWDEASLVFKVQEICQSNGYLLLAKANAAQLSRLVKLAYKHNTGIPFYKIADQGRQLRLEDKRRQQFMASGE